MKTDKKKSNLVKEEIKGKLIQVIESILFKNTEADKKVKKAIKNAASDITKKFLKHVNKKEKKNSKLEKSVSQVKAVKQKSPSVKAKSKVSSNVKSKIKRGK